MTKLNDFHFFIRESNQYAELQKLHNFCFVATPKGNSRKPEETNGSQIRKVGQGKKDHSRQGMC